MHLREFPRQSLAAFVKGNQGVNLGILVLFLWASLLPLCQGTGMIEVHFLNYANPRQTDHQNRCCSGQEVQGRCSSPCRTLFTVCVGFLHNIQGCFLGRKSSGILGNSSFVIPSNSLLQIPWQSIQSWPGSFQLVVRAEHQGVSSSVLIEEAVVKRQNLLPGTQWHNVSHVGTVANITFSYRVVCEQNYYGDSCSMYCLPRDDSNGHYTCDSSGTRVCLPGWKGSFCTEVVCREGCHPTYGSCVTPNTCDCASGWKGANCTQCRKQPGCVHGTCRSPWECNCDFGWGGISCDVDLEVCGRKKPCKNGATCTNIRGGQYACSCAKGYTGKNCTVEINECASDPCFNGGNCTDLIGDFNCSCPEGYSGKQCYPDCGPNACHNGGTCVNGIRGYHCICEKGFTGSICEVVIPTVPTNHSSSNVTTNQPINTIESTTNGTVNTTLATSTTTKHTTKNESMGDTYNSEERKSGITKQTTLIVSIVVSLIILLLCIVACMAWKFWRKHRRDPDNDTAGTAEQSAQAANPKQIDIEDPDSKHCAGARSGNPEIIRNFVASRQQEKNTNKTKENLGDEKILKGKKFRENTKVSLELSDLTTVKTTTTTTTPPTSTTRRMNLDELYLPNRCFDQGFWQEVELEI